MRYVIASIEDNIACLESDGDKEISVNVELLPSDAKEGDILSYDGQSYIVDRYETDRRREAVFEKFNSLFNKNKS